MARLSRKVVWWVFLSVLVIEAIILVPSLYNRKRELLAHVQEVTAAKLMVIMQNSAAGSTDRQLLENLGMLSQHNHVIGGALYRSDGRLVGVFGDSPELNFAELPADHPTGRLDGSGGNYDVAWTSQRWHSGYTMIVRHDASPVYRELVSFALRIAGLVLVISVFVTIGAMLALYPIVIAPILRLRKDLISAGNAIQNDVELPEFQTARETRRDELGEVVAAFIRTFKQITLAINQRKQAEASLQESFSQVASYSEALDRELNQGREMQANFLPQVLPNRPGWEFAAFFKPARQVSGDFYDVFDLGEKHIGVVIADVCGKGVGAALFMALFRSLIRIFSGQTTLAGFELYKNPETEERAGAEARGAGCPRALEAVRLTNKYIVQNHGDLSMFATLFFGIFDTTSGRLSYINAGHDSALVIGPQGVKHRLEPSGPIVGALPEAIYLPRHIVIDSGDILLAFTDGVTDSRSPGDELFGHQRLHQLFDGTFHTAGDLVKNIQQELATFIGQSPQEDDITLLAIHRKKCPTKC
jgi:serine phosphatase RsbU (regulator of sigma subunit)